MTYSVLKKITYSTQLITLALAYKRNNFLKNILGKLFKKLMHLKNKIVVCLSYRSEKAYIIQSVPFLVSCVNETEAGPWCCRRGILNFAKRE